MSWHRFAPRCQLTAVWPLHLTPLWFRWSLHFCLLGQAWLGYGDPASRLPLSPAYFPLFGSVLWMLRLLPSMFCPSSKPVVGLLQMLPMFLGFVQPRNKTYALLQTASWYATSSWRSLSTIRLRVEIFLTGQRCPSPALAGSPASCIQAWFPCLGPGLGPAYRCGEVAGKCWRWFVCWR